MTYEHLRLKAQDLRECWVDPTWTQNGGFRRLDPGWTLLPTSVIHVFFSRTRAVASTFWKPRSKYVAQTGLQNLL